MQCMKYIFELLETIFSSQAFVHQIGAFPKQQKDVHLYKHRQHNIHSNDFVIPNYFSFLFFFFFFFSYLCLLTQIKYQHELCRTECIALCSSFTSINRNSVCTVYFTLFFALNYIVCVVVLCHVVHIILHPPRARYCEYFIFNRSESVSSSYRLITIIIMLLSCVRVFYYFHFHPELVAFLFSFN